MKIAYLEDDPAQSQLVDGILKTAGHECRIFHTGSNLISQFKTTHFDLLLLDWDVPNINGYEVMTWVRKTLQSTIPIVFLTNYALEAYVAKGLAAGADDYITKPFKSAEFIARINANFRRANWQSIPKGSSIVIGDYRINPFEHQVYHFNTPIELTPKEFNVAIELFQNVGKVLSRDFLSSVIWGNNENILSRSLDTHIARIRNKLQLRSDNGLKLTAVYGYGYRLESVSADVHSDT